MEIVNLSTFKQKQSLDWRMMLKQVFFAFKNCFRFLLFIAVGGVDNCDTLAYWHKSVNIKI